MTSNTKKVLIIGAIVLVLLIATPMLGSAAEGLIKKWETDNNVNSYLDAYQDEGGVWTIGYGSIYNYDMHRPVQAGDHINAATALDWMRKECATIIPQIKALVKVPINQNQLDALTSFVYNLGIGSLGDSTLLRQLNAGLDKNTVALQFLRWNKVNINGTYVVLAGLTARRQDEAALFVK